MSKKKKQNNSKIQKKKQKKQAQLAKETITAIVTEAEECQIENDIPSAEPCSEAVSSIEETGDADNCSADSDACTEKEDIIHEAADGKADKPSLTKTDYIALIKERMDDVWNFISETRKISVPLILLIYTAIVVSITIPIEHARVLKEFQKEVSVLEEITNTENSTYTLEKDVHTSLASGDAVSYSGYEFTDTVKGANSDEFGSTYENHSETNTFLDITLEYVYNRETPVSADKLAAMTIKSGNAQYTSFAAVETDEGKNIEFANNIEVSLGDTIRLHYIFDVPKSLKDDSTSLSADVTIEKNTYNINIK